MEKNADANYTDDESGANRIKLNPRTKVHMPNRIWRTYLRNLKPTVNISESVGTTMRLPWSPLISPDDYSAVLGNVYMACSGFAEASTTEPNVLYGTLRVKYYVKLINMQNEYLSV